MRPAVRLDRWAPKVTPVVLRALMRHQDIQTTMKFYVSLEADDLADQLWQDHPAMAAPKQEEKFAL